jgi:hypothetical protein
MFQMSGDTSSFRGRKEVRGVRQLLPMFNGCDAKAMAFELHVKAYSYHVRPKETTLCLHRSLTVVGGAILSDSNQVISEHG